MSDKGSSIFYSAEGFNPDSCYFRNGHIKLKQRELVRKALTISDELSDIDIILIIDFLHLHDRDYNLDGITRKLDAGVQEVVTRWNTNKDHSITHAEQEFLMRTLGWHDYCLACGILMAGGLVVCKIKADNADDRHSYYIVDTAQSVKSGVSVISDDALEIRLREAVKTMGTAWNALGKSIVPKHSNGNGVTAFEYAICAYPDWQLMDLDCLRTALLYSNFGKTPVPHVVHVLDKSSAGRLLMRNLYVVMEKILVLPKRLRDNKEYIVLIGLDRILSTYSLKDNCPHDAIIGYGLRYLESCGYCLDLLENDSANLSNISGSEAKYSLDGCSIDFIYDSILQDRHINNADVRSAVVSVCPKGLDTYAAISSAVNQALVVIKARDTKMITPMVRELVDTYIAGLNGTSETDPEITDWVLDRLTLHAMTSPSALKDDVHKVLEAARSPEPNYA